MKCPKCGYTSFDYLMECKKCGEILEDCRRALNLRMNEPTIFTNLEEETEPSYSDEDDLRISDSLSDTEIPQDSIVFGDFQPPLDAAEIPTDIPDIPDLPPDTASALERNMQQDDFDLELDTLTPLSDGATPADITFDGFTTGSEEITKTDLSSTAKESSLLESNSMPDASDPATGNSDFNLDMELPFDFSETDTLKTGVPADEPATGVVELNLDDDESLDKILADLDGNGNK